jgi:hypothetical protein
MSDTICLLWTALGLVALILLATTVAAAVWEWSEAGDR